MEGKYFANGKLSIIIIKSFPNIIVCGCKYIYPSFVFCSLIVIIMYCVCNIDWLKRNWCSFTKLYTHFYRYQLKHTTPIRYYSFYLNILLLSLLPLITNNTIKERFNKNLITFYVFSFKIFKLWASTFMMMTH